VEVMMELKMRLSTFETGCAGKQGDTWGLILRQAQDEVFVCGGTKESPHPELVEGRARKLTPYLNA
jgi:hypothetical protein